MFLPTKVHQRSPHQGPPRRLTWVKRVDESWGQDVQQRHWLERRCCHQNIQKEVWQQSRPSMFRNPTENQKNVQDSQQSTFRSPFCCFPNSLPYTPGKRKRDEEKEDGEDSKKHDKDKDDEKNYKDKKIIDSSTVWPHTHLTCARINSLAGTSQLLWLQNESWSPKGHYKRFIQNMVGG